MTLTSCQSRRHLPVGGGSGLKLRPVRTDCVGCMGKLGYRPALDGVRALAIAPVVTLHAFGWPRNGSLGVEIFFVLSGFLITSLLLEERDATGSISLFASAVNDWIIRRPQPHRHASITRIRLVADCPSESATARWSRCSTTIPAGDRPAAPCSITTAGVSTPRSLTECEGYEH